MYMKVIKLYMSNSSNISMTLVDKYDSDFEEDPEPVKDEKRHIIGLGDDEVRMNGKTVSVDVHDKEKEEDKQGDIPKHRKVCIQCTNNYL